MPTTMKPETLFDTLTRLAASNMTDTEKNAVNHCIKLYNQAAAGLFGDDDPCPPAANVKNCADYALEFPGDALLGMACASCAVLIGLMIYSTCKFKMDGKKVPFNKLDYGMMLVCGCTFMLGIIMYTTKSSDQKALAGVSIAILMAISGSVGAKVMQLIDRSKRHDDYRDSERDVLISPRMRGRDPSTFVSAQPINTEVVNSADATHNRQRIAQLERELAEANRELRTLTGSNAELKATNSHQAERIKQLEKENTGLNKKLGKQPKGTPALGGPSAEDIAAATVNQLAQFAQRGRGGGGYAQQQPLPQAQQRLMPPPTQPQQVPALLPPQDPHAGGQGGELARSLDNSFM